MLVFTLDCFLVCDFFSVCFICAIHASVHFGLLLVCDFFSVCFICAIHASVHFGLF